MFSFNVLIDKLSVLCVRLGAIGVLLMVALMGLGVVFRYVFKSPLIWADEAVRYVLVFSVLFAVGDVMRRGENIRVDILLEPLGDKIKYLVEVIGLICALIFALALTYLGLEMVLFSYELGLTTGTKIDIPSFWVELALPLGGFLLSLATFTRLWRILKGEDIFTRDHHAPPAGSDRE
jgi:TRAP-type C4-dicarboxylate transport system permease small subunit